MFSPYTNPSLLNFELPHNGQNILGAGAVWWVKFGAWHHWIKFYLEKRCLAPNFYRLT
jgi:hypothetical protein